MQIRYNKSSSAGKIFWNIPPILVHHDITHICFSFYLLLLNSLTMLSIISRCAYSFIRFTHASFVIIFALKFTNPYLSMKSTQNNHDTYSTDRSKLLMKSFNLYQTPISSSRCSALWTKKCLKISPSLSPSILFIQSFFEVQPPVVLKTSDLPVLSTQNYSTKKTSKALVTSGFVGI